MPIIRKRQLYQLNNYNFLYLTLGQILYYCQSERRSQVFGISYKDLGFMIRKNMKACDELNEREFVLWIN